MSSYRLHPEAVQRHRKRWATLGLCALIVGAIISGWFLLPHHDKRKANLEPVNTKVVAEKDPIVTGIESKVLFAGDIYWGRSMTKWSNESPLKTAYPFSGLSGFKKDAYDAWVGNLECPTVPGAVPTEHEEKVLLMFNCSTDFLPEFAKWFDIVSLANNHTDNQKASGFTATREQLDANHVQYFGHYDPAATADVCEVISLPVRSQLSGGSEKSGSLPVALCGYHGVFKVPSDASLAVIQQYARYMPVILMTHMGTEYKATADALRTNVYRKMIDNGAEAVLGGHPHWVQNSESYQGKLIAYSLGNFIFDQQFESDVMRGAVMTLDLSLDPKFDAAALEQWLKLGETCAKFKDTCLAEAEKQKLERLPLKLTWGMLASDSSGKLTKPADTAVSQAVAERLNWNQTAGQLIPAGVPYKP